MRYIFFILFIVSFANADSSSCKYHLIYETGAAVSLSVISSLLGAVIGTVIDPDKSGPSNGFAAGLVIGYYAGDALGVSLVGNNFHEKGSFLLSFLGSVSFSFIGYGLGSLIDNSTPSKTQRYNWAFAITFPIIGSSIGYHLGSLFNRDKTIIF
ncbi:MAG: hypothetical protein PHG23_02775 [Candidatus Pacebacteria bacterium]|nr:hypothetical protein [Candidatus Paceibacterota bacterium]